MYNEVKRLLAHWLYVDAEVDAGYCNVYMVNVKYDIMLVHAI
ncbi:MAG: hypothetical protein QW248_02520 [Candidatus Nitrosocaldus sp.]